MNDAERYQKELDTILQELEAKERLREQQRAKDLREARESMGPAMNNLAKALGLTDEQRDKMLDNLINDIWAE